MFGRYENGREIKDEASFRQAGSSLHYAFGIARNILLRTV